METHTDCSAPDCSAPDCSAPDCSAPDPVGVDYLTPEERNYYDGLLEALKLKKPNVPEGLLKLSIDAWWKTQKMNETELAEWNEKWSK